MLFDSFFTGLFAALINAASVQPIVSALASLATEIIAMNNDFTTSLFDNSAITSFLWFISIVGSIFFVFGIGFAFSEWAIDCNENSGSPNIMATFKNSFIGFAALSGFSVLPILLLKWINDLASLICSSLTGATLEAAMNSIWTKMENMDFLSGWGSPIFTIIIFVCIIRVFLANIKRGGIMVTLITVGSLHMFSIPRGYTDAFWNWCKQIVGLCITSFMQNVLLILGIIVYVNSNMYVFDLILGAGVMLSATEVPRILQQFGLDTSMKANVSQAIYGASGIMNIASVFMR